ncbi:hypothetical protein Tco_0404684 [Tanacetum coccineum]
MEGSYYSFPCSIFPSGRTVKLRNDILMFQQHQGESLSEWSYGHQYCMEDPEQAFVEYASSCTDETGGEGITRESYKPRPSSDGVGAQIPYYARKDFLDCHFPEEWEIAIDAEINPFKDVLVFRRMVEFLGAIPKNLKSNMLYLTRKSLEILRKFHWMILGGRFNQLSHVSSPLLSKPGEY